MKFNFSNKNLQDIHASAEQSITSHLAQLDEVSNDIKALEEALTKAGISVTLLYQFEQLFLERGRSLCIDDSIWVRVRVEIQHFIVWDRDKQRLLHEVHETEREIYSSEETSRVWGPYIKHSKPLIETKTHIRLKVLPELECFYDRMIKLLGQGQVEERIVELSPSLMEQLSLVPF